MQYQIGKLADLTGLAAETIRYYETQGLIGRPLRTASNYRVYGEAHRERLAFIRHCRSLDLSIEEIRALLRVRDQGDSGCEDANSVLDRHIDHVTQRLAELRSLRRELLLLRQRCAVEGTAKTCGILAGIATVARAVEPVRPRQKRKPASDPHRLRRRRRV